MYPTYILFFILYDSITNSIFDSQIVQPLLKRKNANQGLNITIISFEKREDREKVKKIAKSYTTFIFIFLYKIPYLCPLLLYPAVYQLRNLLVHYAAAYEIIARGPLAGYLCLKASTKQHCQKIIIQARGALAAEYGYATQTTNKIKQRIHTWRTQQFSYIEALVYKKQSYTIPISIECVSIALKDYLIKTYQADPQAIVIAQLDIPLKMPSEAVQQWRQEKRIELGIPENCYVYCYNGSLRPWQCPQETIEYFKEQYLKNPSSFLLILTQDKIYFEQLLLSKNIETKYYKVLTVKHTEIFKYLAASDAGLIFREKNILNWVSRPTKILEYQAVGLSIIHNNTIAMLQNN